MSLPSDVNADVAEAVEALEVEAPPVVRRGGRSLFRKVAPEQYGFAAAMLVAFLGVAVCGPKVYAMRHPRRPGVPERARRAAREAARRMQDQARDVRADAGRRVRQLGDVARRR